MTGEILKHINKAKRCGEFTTPPNVCVPYLDALRVAVEELHELHKSYPEIDGWEISLIERKIAKILGVKEGEK